ncbi:transketolase family protein [Candidatus Epulonipiscium viviparus]|uniref:transketolase family protein n=1 Tax=Candidatus Epulonipiscium viviparus TaxID=420336 RepID=UPI0027381549|nr:transketolase C-terminal domain-containing protein [Candidatus Epulopiscium viviparus]
MERVIKVYDNAFAEYGKDKPEVIAFSADLSGGCEVREFWEKYPDRFYSMGIAEQNMHSFAGGMALEGFVPFVHTFAVFIYRRSLDMVHLSIAHPNVKVRLVGSVPGVTSPAGATHQALDDIAVMRAVPNMTVLECGDATDVESFFQLQEQINGPVYIRVLRGEVPRLFNTPMELNKSRMLSDGEDVVILSSGVCTEEAMRAVDSIKKAGISVHHRHITCLKPFEDQEVLEAIKKAKYGIITMENHNVLGGLGSIVADMMAEHGVGKKLFKVGIQDEYMHGGSKLYLMKRYGLDAMALVKKVNEVVGRDLGITEDMLEAFHFELENDATRALGV